MKRPATVIACGTLTAALLLHTTSLAGEDSNTAIPAREDLGPPTSAPFPPLGNISGVGKGPGGAAPAKIRKVVEAARSDRRDALRGRKKTNPLDKLGRSVALLVTPTQLGSATLINHNGTFVTSWHIVRDLKSVGVIYMPSNHDDRPTEADAVQAHVERIDETSDLALVKVTALPKGTRPMEIVSLRKASPGMHLQTIGHPYGEIWTYTQGTLLAEVPDYKWTGADGVSHQADVIHFQTASVTGNAGGPILDSRDRLIAVDAMRKDDGNNIGLAVSAREVLRLVASPPKSLTSASSPTLQKSACEPKRLETRRNKANTGTIHVLDLNCNGRTDAMLLVPDSPKLANHLANDANENGTTDSVYFDFNRDGKFDEVRFDTDEDGKADLVGKDFDAELVPQSVRVLEK